MRNQYSRRCAPLLLPYRRRFFSIQRCKVPCVTSRLRLEVRPELRCPNCRRGPEDVASRAIGMLIGPHRASSSDFILASRHVGAARAPRPGRRALRLLLHSGCCVALQPPAAIALGRGQNWPKSHINTRGEITELTKGNAVAQRGGTDRLECARCGRAEAKRWVV